MRLTYRQKKLVNDLESLVGMRCTLDSLNRKLSEFTGETISVVDITSSKDEDDLSDWNLLFEINSEENDELYGYFDIYYLKLRKPGYFGETMYITEISYEFENL
jgi:hypothetical protein